MEKISTLVKKMISSAQIRAARALLDLSQKETAEGASIAMTTLSGIEGGNTTPSQETARKLQSFFEGCGLEFFEPNGVREQPQDIEYRGQRGMQKFFDSVYESGRHGSDICIFNGVPHELVRWAGEDFYNAHAARMQSIKTRYSIRCIVKEGEGNLIGSGFAEYRAIPATKFHDKTFYVFGERVAFFTFGNELLIKVMRGQDLADSMRVLFNFAWDAAR